MESRKMQFPQLAVDAVVEQVGTSLRESLTHYIGDKCDNVALENIRRAVEDQFRQLYMDGYTSFPPEQVGIEVTENWGNANIKLHIPDEMQRELDMTLPTWREVFQCP